MRGADRDLVTPPRRSALGYVTRMKLLVPGPHDALRLVERGTGAADRAVAGSAETLGRTGSVVDEADDD